MSKKSTIRIQQVKSAIGATRGQKEALRGIGLRRMWAVVEREDTASVRGSVAKIPHLARILEDES